MPNFPSISQHYKRYIFITCYHRASDSQRLGRTLSTYSSSSFVSQSSLNSSVFDSHSLQFEDLLVEAELPVRGGTRGAGGARIAHRVRVRVIDIDIIRAFLNQLASFVCGKYF